MKQNMIYYSPDMTLAIEWPDDKGWYLRDVPYLGRVDPSVIRDHLTNDEVTSIVRVWMTVVH